MPQDGLDNPVCIVGDWSRIGSGGAISSLRSRDIAVASRVEMMMSTDAQDGHVLPNRMYSCSSLLWFTLMPGQRAP